MTATRARRSTAARTARDYRRYHVSWLITFLPALVLPLWGWTRLHELYRYEGLGVMELAGLLTVPVAVLALLYFLPAFVRAGCCPRDWRKRHRQRLTARGIPRSAQRSSYISDGLRRVVFFADRYRCVACRARLHDPGVPHLEWDHTMPWSLGGLTTLFNGMTLCPDCNRIKSNYWRYRRSGHAVYVPFSGWVNEAAAEAILAAELRHRWNVIRLLRAAFALGW